jgi:hypothetical protein
MPDKATCIVVATAGNVRPKYRTEQMDKFEALVATSLAYLRWEATRVAGVIEDRVLLGDFNIDGLRANDQVQKYPSE